ncbi:MULTISPECIES: M48 family metallopeptidase [Asaia]|uniref:Zn-dependent protease n=1 Tax=Asaia bogorensis TaxID=91915 RepID=A0A060QH11_9PROT|nr:MULTISPECIES: M48 family metallopeptidase [Asaia]ETC97994.1 peptidase [Asaia sp. SF2.1]CDG38082.1 Zn-dependent protease [Asaia bogorensis]
MTSDIKQYRHAKERLYGGTLTVLGTVVWLILLAAFVMVALVRPNGLAQLVVIALYLAVLGAISLVAAALYRAYALGNMVALSSRQFPELHATFAEVSQRLGLQEVPRAFIYNSHGITNAFAIRLLRGRYVFLTSAIIETDTDAQLRFIMGHEIAHHVLGHLDGFKTFLRAPAYLVPLLYRAYSRGREYRCDAVGASILPDYRDGVGALQMLACGARRLNTSMNAEAFAEQEAQVPGMAGFMVEIMSTHPRLTRRVSRLIALFATPEQKHGAV